MERPPPEKMGGCNAAHPPPRPARSSRLGTNIVSKAGGARRFCALAGSNVEMRRWRVPALPLHAGGGEGATSMMDGARGEGGRNDELGRSPRGAFRRAISSRNERGDRFRFEAGRDRPGGGTGLDDDDDQRRRPRWRIANRRRAVRASPLFPTTPRDATKHERRHGESGTYGLLGRGVDDTVQLDVTTKDGWTRSARWRWVGCDRMDELTSRSGVRPAGRVCV